MLYPLKEPEALCKKIFPHVDHVLIDRMNYTSKTLNIYRRLKLQNWLDRGFADGIIKG